MLPVDVSGQPMLNEGGSEEAAEGIGKGQSVDGNALPNELRAITDVTTLASSRPTTSN